MADKWNEVGQTGFLAKWDFSKSVGEVLEGKLTAKTRDVGKNKATIYEVTMADGTKVIMWETAVLRSKLEQVPEGQEVKITYLGEKQSTKGPGKYHDFQVLTDGPVIDRDTRDDIFNPE